ncbi:MAG: thiamine pyrophosphate-dependent enzyme [Proteobacteria bacterium]|nr:thiamine pyrophosphate-dependent enzyme [Pseudomonadota bacterium]
MNHGKEAQLKNLEISKDQALNDYKTAFISREVSLLGRREVLSGKAKFGIFGDGKEIAQVAMARAFKAGDWRAGYYRDQTFMMAIGGLTVTQFFAQLFADTSLERDPHSGGRQMNNHPATRYMNEYGEWLNQLSTKNTSSDISPTGGQMPRVLGLAYASKIYRENSRLNDNKKFSDGGREIAFGTIGNASTSEGLFWETMNAAGVLQVPLLMSVWDDGYGISVPSRYQTTKESISKVLAGFEYEEGKGGFKIFEVKGWDYPSLLKVYLEAERHCRSSHIPCLIHVTEVTQPQGHSTSGSHERYKSTQRLEWEKDFDGLTRMRSWMVQSKLASISEIEKLEKDAIDFVDSQKSIAWNDYITPIEKERAEAIEVLSKLGRSTGEEELCAGIAAELKKVPSLFRRNIQSSLKKAQFQLGHISTDKKLEFLRYLDRYADVNQKKYSKFLFNEGPHSPLLVKSVNPIYSDKSEKVDGRQIIQKFFDKLLQDDPRVFVCGEDIGQLGGVNLEFEGLQEKHGSHRVTDTGIREATIFGQCFGAAMRGLRPVADIQYLDYLLYCFQGMSDDLATLHYRTAGGQSAPLIVRTKGHRLEGIWHTGSPMGMIINGIRGVHVCVPRNMTQAAGMYRTLFNGDDPALVIEVLSGYRLKETLPDNIGEYTVPLGVPEIIREGSDVTLVTYGASVRVAQEGMKLLENVGISVELIDVQTLLPFDLNSSIVKSLAKTNALVCLDEDVPGGASAFMLQQIVEVQKGYEHLDCTPKTLTAKDHRAAYASDGDYYSKPNPEDVFETIYDLMSERNPARWPNLKV